MPPEVSEPRMARRRLVSIRDVMLADEAQSKDDVPASSWVKCSERMPEVGRSYLIGYRYKRDRRFGYTVLFARTDGRFGDEEEWVSWGEEVDQEMLFWAPLPEPPEDQKHVRPARRMVPRYPDKEKAK